MGKLFGTDGIRGVVGENLTAQLAYRIGCAVAIVLSEKCENRPKVIIGRDTRISGDMLENALSAGLCSYGADVVKLGVIPTPAVAFLAAKEGMDAGAVISASHNPYEHNGIKLFSGTGYKLRDDVEEAIEEYILADRLPASKKFGEIGIVIDGTEYRREYIDFLASTVPTLSGMHVLVDCANGAASTTAPELFRKTGIEAEFIHAQPNGININDQCGSTHLEILAQRVRKGGYSLGIAFDGDADRCLAVDENGCTVDGDQIMAICARVLKREGKLLGEGFVATVMSNLGLHRYCAEEGLKLRCAAVGDRNVLEMMQNEGMMLGGEQSGHVIFLNYMTTGDGELTALQLLRIVREEGRTLSELAGVITHYPQILINVPGPAGNAEKKALIAHPILQAAVKRESSALGSNGRILLRPSGTEALIRVMVEAPTEEIAKDTAERVAAEVRALL